MSKKVTKREHQVLQLIYEEMTNREIAKCLYVSNHTIISHRKSLLRKLDARNTAGLIKKGFERGLLHLNLPVSISPSV